MHAFILAKFMVVEFCSLQSSFNQGLCWTITITVLSQCLRYYSKLVILIVYDIPGWPNRVTSGRWWAALFKGFCFKPSYLYGKISNTRESYNVPFIEMKRVCFFLQKTSTSRKQSKSAGIFLWLFFSDHWFKWTKRFTFSSLLPCLFPSWLLSWPHFYSWMFLSA